MTIDTFKLDQHLQSNEIEMFIELFWNDGRVRTRIVKTTIDDPEIYTIGSGDLIRNFQIPGGITMMQLVRILVDTAHEHGRSIESERYHAHIEQILETAAHENDQTVLKRNTSFERLR